MNLFKNMRISSKIYLVLTVILIALVFISSFGLYQASEINKRVDNLYTQELIPLTLVGKMKGSIYRIRDRVARHMQEPERQKDHEAKIVEQIERLQKNEDKYRVSRLSKKEEQFFKEFHQSWDRYLEIVNSTVLPLSRQHQFDEAEKILFSEGLTTFRLAREALNKLSDYQIERAKKRHTNSGKAYDDMFTLSIVISLLVTILAILAIRFLVLNPLKALGVMRKVMLDISKNGDFSKRIPISAKDDIGELAEALNEMVDALQQSISESNRVMGAVVGGDFSQRINGCFKGDLLTLKEAVNGSTSSVDEMMSEILKIVNALGNGDFSVKMSKQVEPSIRKQVEGSLEVMSAVISEVNSVLNSMAKGDFSNRINIEAQGELKSMIDNVNESMEQTSMALKEIVVVVSALSQGDLTQSVAGSYEGAYAEVAQALNESLRNVSGLISETSSGVHGLLDNVGQISQGSQDLNNRTQQQAAALEETAATMEQITDAVQHTKENAQAANELAIEVRKHADEGAIVMRSTIESMIDIREASHKIEEIITLIDSIAFQTNLLALNAAVEAARAGEHGRGFAVVASEVRSLAGKSSDAARDIKGLIENAVTAVEEGTERAESSDKALQTIIEGIRKVSSIVSDISEASVEQSNSISQTGLAIAEIDTVTQQNAALVEETSASSETMQNEVLMLNDLVGKFKV